MVHCFEMLDSSIAIDVYSGCVHVMEKPAYMLTKYYSEAGFETDGLSEKAVAFCDGISREALEEAYGEIKELYDGDMLFTEDCYQEIAKNFKKGTVVKALCLHVAHDCNLRCKYCFADEGDYGGKKGLMSLDTAKAAIDFVIENSASRKNIEVDFFGGEPLLNFDVVKETVKYAREQEKIHGKNFRFTITTNGILLDDEKLAFINENMCNIVLSIDGRKEVNDRVRVNVNKKGCYDKIVPVFQKVAQSRNQDNYYVRGTFTRYNLDFAKDVLHLADLGFKQISVEPVVAPFEEDYALQYEDIDTICKEYETLAKEYIKRKKEGKGFNFFHFMIDLDQGPCVVKRLSGCGCGCEYMAVTPEGDIYPCHQFAGNEEFKVGNLKDGITNTELTAKFAKTNVYTKPDCSNCWAKFYCSGGCVANAQNFNGSIEKPYDLACHLQKKRVECAIAIKAAL
ncbi:MAG: thioether cross-link-forming SCIFF peptide maturase [Clostridia bacterium]|nr:thioether cross-link-forming SCIFF peptide maturase [Clostridia bacterium]